ncbi:hypothetical protein ACTXT7_015776, partial [Hymenolepis weldensis]
MAAIISTKDSSICSQTDVTWSHIDLSLVELVRSISYIILVDSYSEWPEVIPFKSAAIGTVIGLDEQLFDNVKKQVFVLQGEETVERILNSFK